MEWFTWVLLNPPTPGILRQAQEELISSVWSCYLPVACRGWEEKATWPKDRG